MLTIVPATWFQVSVLQTALPAEHECGTASLWTVLAMLLLMVSMAARVVVVERPAGLVVIVWSAEISCVCPLMLRLSSSFFEL